MESFVLPVQLRWSDLDPNFHLRHSVYYDWGAMSRIEFLQAHGLTASVMGKLHFGPIIFREECIFKKEIRTGDPVTISLELAKSRKDFSRWTFRHTIYKQSDIVCAILTVDGAWMDTIQRKLTIPPQEAVELFSKAPQSRDFIWE
jgi:acyl-CoA thioester hydrolase